MTHLPLGLGDPDDHHEPLSVPAFGRPKGVDALGTTPQKLGRSRRERHEVPAPAALCLKPPGTGASRERLPCGLLGYVRCSQSSDERLLPHRATKREHELTENREQ